MGSIGRAVATFGGTAVVSSFLPFAARGLLESGSDRRRRSLVGPGAAIAGVLLGVAALRVPGWRLGGGAAALGLVAGGLVLPDSAVARGRRREQGTGAAVGKSATTDSTPPPVASQASDSAEPSIAPYTGPDNPTTRAQLLHKLAWEFEQEGIPARLALAVTLQETTSADPNARQSDAAGNVIGDGAVGMFQTFTRSMQTGAPGRGAGLGHADQILKAQQHPEDPVTKYYTTDMQIDDAVNWFSDYKPDDVNLKREKPLVKWAIRAQNPGHDTYAPELRAELEKADRLLRKHVYSKEQ